MLTFKSYFKVFLYLTILSKKYEKYEKKLYNDLEFLIQALNILQISLIPVEDFYKFLRDNHTYSSSLL